MERLRQILAWVWMALGAVSAAVWASLAPDDPEIENCGVKARRE